MTAQQQVVLEVEKDKLKKMIQYLMQSPSGLTMIAVHGEQVLSTTIHSQSAELVGLSCTAEELCFGVKFQGVEQIVYYTLKKDFLNGGSFKTWYAETRTMMDIKLDKEHPPLPTDLRFIAKVSEYNKFEKEAVAAV